MVDEEAKIIREEVMRALAEQEDGAGSSADAGSVPEETMAPAAQVFATGGLSSDFGDVLSGAGGTTGALREKEEVDEERAETAALSSIFDDVRAQSAASQLVEPSRWVSLGMVPCHQTPEDWEMFVYEYVEEHGSGCGTEAVQAAPMRTATRSVGVPCIMRSSEDGEGVSETAACEGAGSSRESFPGDESGRGGEAYGDSPEAEAAAALLDESGEGLPVVGDGSAHDRDADCLEPVCDDIVALTGERGYYLYSNEYMTDAYARWSFLAAEDDRVFTFVECVRDESRTYPRPMGAAALTNEPFNLQPNEVAELWEAIRQSDAYPDLDTVTASNGDVYYFSTEYLTPAYAASLAEWNSVERDMFL